MTSEENNFRKKSREPKSNFTIRINLNEYLANATDTKCDLIDGQYFHHSPASQKHVKLRQFLISILDFFVSEHDLGIVLRENFPINLNEKKLARARYYVHFKKSVKVLTENDFFRYSHFYH